MDDDDIQERGAQARADQALRCTCLDEAEDSRSKKRKQGGNDANETVKRVAGGGDVDERRTEKRGEKTDTQEIEMWQDKVETCVSSPDPRFIHSTNLAHPSYLSTSPIQLLAYSPVRPSIRPAFQLVPVPSIDRPTDSSGRWLGGSVDTVRSKGAWSVVPSAVFRARGYVYVHHYGACECR